MIGSVKYLVCTIFVVLVLSSSAQIKKDSAKVAKTATHASMKKKTIKAIAKSIVNSKYKDWKITEAQKEIFRDSDTNSLVAYKITVINNTDIHYLFYKADGALLLDKEVQP